MIHVVTGPPCAGKSTFVAENAGEGSVRVDYDAIAVALGSGNDHAAPYEIGRCALAAREAAIKEATDLGTEAWVIHTAPSEAQRREYSKGGAIFHDLDPGMGECMRRAVADGRPEGTEQAIRKWYGQRSGKDQMTKERILAEPDTQKRRRLIAENLDLF